MPAFEKDQIGHVDAANDGVLQPADRCARTDQSHGPDTQWAVVRAENDGFISVRQDGPARVVARRRRIENQAVAAGFDQRAAPGDFAGLFANI